MLSWKSQQFLVGIPGNSQMGNFANPNSEFPEIPTKDFWSITEIPVRKEILVIAGQI